VVAQAEIRAQDSLVHKRTSAARLRAAFLRLAWLTLGAGGVCAVAGQADAQETVLASVTPPKPDDEGDVVPTCKTDFRLSGAVFDARHPERSFALVEVKKNERASLVRVGSWLGGFQILAVEPRGILLRDANGACWLRLVGDPAARGRQAPPPPPRRAEAKPAPPKQKKSEVVVIGHR
jgi:hypothetical protein